ncbi:alpha/beta fold hydrolase [Paraflavitalea pollutisoli]|uniref:alpha/beta fold hydrolase n=1 Tax=Paraflavitalea pollutisoli TaxID=3034143 RepID=UPI0023ED6E17|nr:alpha/beta hydrolase [Paraflavitalea sp. H1-2-19X]
MQSAILSYKHSQIHFSAGGAGEKLLLCLHGYGESEKTFHFLERHLPTGYQLVALDLPFHGGTQWQEGLDFSMEDLLSILAGIRQHLGIPAARLSLMGFSMGGRVALSLLETIPDQIDRVLLLAPDGLKVNFWYRFATRSVVGKQLFRFTMQHPGWFHQFLKAGNRLKLINQSIFKFTNYYINDRRVRDELYNRWTCMRHFRPHLQVIKSLIVQYRIPVRLLYGKYDRIIRYERGEKFSAGIESFCTLQVIPTGHQVLQEKNVPTILSMLES